MNQPVNPSTGSNGMDVVLETFASGYIHNQECMMMSFLLQRDKNDVIMRS